MAPVVDHSINNKILQSAISTPQAWVVQLGSFSLKNNAEKLVQRLRKQGFDAYSRSNDENHHLITRVFVGPEINRGTMQHINKKLQHDFHLKGVVRKYNV
jgi:DedD protein